MRAGTDLYTPLLKILPLGDARLFGDDSAENRKFWDARNQYELWLGSLFLVNQADFRFCWGQFYAFFMTGSSKIREPGTGEVIYIANV